MIEWVDRVPTKPNRVLITPENGGTAWYATVERADEPQVNGTPVNAANLNAMQLAAGLSENKTVYVAMNGSDSVGNGTSSAPYATITKALSVIPKNLNGYNATIRVAGGVYSENVSVEKFSGGYVIISGEVDASVTINYLYVNHCILSIENIKVTIANHYGNDSLYVLGGRLYVTNDLTIKATGNNGIYLNRSSTLYVNGVLTIDGVSATPIIGIIVVQSSSVYVVEFAGGSNVNTGINVADGGIVAFRSNNMTSRTAYVTSNGGRIYSSAQNNTPNY